MNDQEAENRLKRLKYRANHRGIKEMDIILGTFANAQLDRLEANLIDDFEVLMSEHDRDLLIWFTGEAPFPYQELTEIFEKVSEYSSNRARHDQA